MKMKLYISLALPVLFALYSLFAARSDILLNSLFTVVLLLIADFLLKKFPIFPAPLIHGIYLFILLSVFFGRTLNIYAFIPFWDKILHFLSGILLVIIGRSLYIFFKGDPKSRLFFVFPLAFAVALAGVWEIYEFTVDALLGTHSQNASLTDTMWDMILGSGSALLTALFQNKKYTP